MIIYHITSRAEWEAAKVAGQYIAPSLETEGFIHASTAEQVVNTGNRYYHGQFGLVMLQIDTNKLKSEVRFESAMVNNEEQKFPHIYGPLNLEAVNDIFDFLPDENGDFSLPAELTRRY